MKILVTGAAGFIGQALMRKLLELGHNPIGLDIDRDPYWVDDDIRKHIIYDDIRWPQSSLTMTLLSKYAEQIDGCEVIFNLASVPSPTQYEVRQYEAFTTSVLGIMSCTDYAKKHGSILIHASSSEVYGETNNQYIALNEWEYSGMSPIGVRACYSEGKRAAETYLDMMRRKHNLDVRIARIFNTYGPGMRDDDGRVIPEFICRALRGDPLIVYGEERTRSFCYIDDMVDLLIAVMQCPIGYPINLGDNHKISVKELAELIVELTGSKSKITTYSARHDEPRYRCPDLYRQFLTLDMSPKTNLKDGLLKTIEYFKGRML